MKVVHLHRKPQEGYHSIENIYAAIREELKNEVNIHKIEMPFYCKTQIGKIMNMIYVLFLKGDVFHITGDIHYVSFFLPKGKTIISAHSVEGGRPKYSGWRKKMFRYLYFKKPNKKSKYWSAVSEYTKRELIDLLSVSKEKIKVIYNPLLNVFKENIKKIPKEKPVLLQVGTHERKNIPILIEAIKEIECTLHLIGELNIDLKNKLEDNKIDYKVTLKASPEEMNSIYSQSDVVLIISSEESFGMPIIEAQAKGIPVVTSKKSAMPEIGGRGVAYVNEKDKESINKTISKILQNDTFRNELIGLGKKNAERFSLNEISKQYLKLYQEINE